MANREQLRMLLQRALDDAGFRAEFLARPAAVAAALKFKLTAVQIAAVRGLRGTVKQQADALARMVRAESAVALIRTPTTMPKPPPSPAPAPKPAPPPAPKSQSARKRSA
jgi:hypothetical protein